MEVTFTINMSFLLSEGVLNIPLVESRVSEIFARQDWTAWVSEERAPSDESELLLFVSWFSIHVLFVGSSIVAICFSRLQWHIILQFLMWQSHSSS